MSNKKIFPTKEVAEDALIEAHTRFDYGKGKGPIAVYQCEDCGQYHLTSQGQANEKLVQYKKEGKIDLQKAANHWLTKLRNK